MDYLLHKAEDYYDFRLQFWFWGLIISEDKDYMFWLWY
jgi:hypothetical protein